MKKVDRCKSIHKKHQFSACGIGERNILTLKKRVGKVPIYVLNKMKTVDIKKHQIHVFAVTERNILTVKKVNKVQA